MCQAKVYLAANGSSELIAEDVIMLEEVPEGVRLATFFEEPQLVRARVVSVDFLKHTVNLVPLSEEQPDGR
ncbi:MAG: CooT family nickel-binding protein [Anaerolineae bacterium]|jgi:predicted RNA-binding protein